MAYILQDDQRTVDTTDGVVAYPRMHAHHPRVHGVSSHCYGCWRLLSGGAKVGRGVVEEWQQLQSVAELLRGWIVVVKVKSPFGWWRLDAVRLSVSRAAPGGRKESLEA